MESESKKLEGRSNLCVCVLPFPTQFLSLLLGLLVHQWKLEGLHLPTEQG